MTKKSEERKLTVAQAKAWLLVHSTKYSPRELPDIVIKVPVAITRKHIKIDKRAAAIKPKVEMIGRKGVSWSLLYYFFNKEFQEIWAKLAVYYPSKKEAKESIHCEADWWY